MLNVSKLQSLLDYDLDSGVFKWLKLGIGRRANKIAGCQTDKGYIAIVINGKRYLAHRLAWLYMTGEWPIEIDHINGCRSDNRWVNLREVTHAINCQNQRKARSDSKTNLLGVYRKKDKISKPWAAYIKLAGKNHFIGYFSKSGDAHKAYIEAKRLIHIGCMI